nr:hypothetical protein CFP56_55030 [Quercus suber]
MYRRRNGRKDEIETIWPRSGAHRVFLGEILRLCTLTITPVSSVDSAGEKPKKNCTMPPPKPQPFLRLLVTNHSTPCRDMRTKRARSRSPVLRSAAPTHAVHRATQGDHVSCPSFTP